jgi:hypothetical protein
MERDDAGFVRIEAVRPGSFWVGTGIVELGAGEKRTLKLGTDEGRLLELSSFE